MLKRLDKFINGVTMYRLMLYGLAALAVVATVFAAGGILPLQGWSLATSALLLLGVCWSVNRVFAAILRAPLNPESALITALILFFVMTPAANATAAWSLAIAGTGAMASKYLFAVRGRHIFNPAAFGAAFAGFIGFGGSSWWVSDPAMLPFVLVVGLLVVRKLRRFEMFFVFLAAGLAAILAFSAATGLLQRVGAPGLLVQAFSAWPLVFFGAIMLTEPRTTPPTRGHRGAYGALAGALFGAPFNISIFYFASEMALIAANLYSFAVSMKIRLFPALKEKRELAPGIFEFVFDPGRRFAFTPGQYLEWTLPHRRPDSRGVRRYFTIAASPSEKEIRVTAKIFDRSSSFKKALMALAPGGAGKPIAAGALSGDFTLPKDPAQPLVFIAGGVGITPFRSMVKYLLDTRQKRDVVLFYACARASEFVYEDLFMEAEQAGLKTVYVVTDAANAPSGWKGRTGYIDQAMIEAEVPGHRDRAYYLSGPPTMVDSYRALLRSIGVPRRQVKTDYFPGY